MANLVYTDNRSRFELNLDEEPGFVVELLGWLAQRKAEPEPEYEGSAFGQKPPGFGHITSPPPSPTAAPLAPAPVTTCGPGVAEAVIVQVSGVPDSEPAPEVARPAAVEPNRTSGLMTRTCALDGCDVVFQPTRVTNRFCCTSHKNRHNQKLWLAKRRKAPNEAGAFECPDCPRTFATSTALGGHRSVHPGEKPRNSGGRKASAPARRASSAVESPPARTQPEDRTVRCPEAELQRHRIAYHDAPPVAKVTETISALTFRCSDCGREYDDSNRLKHHRSVTHDPPEPVAHVVEAHGHHAERVG